MNPTVQTMAMMTGMRAMNPIANDAYAIEDRTNTRINAISVVFCVSA